jgi:hypothetical protein
MYTPKYTTLENLGRKLRGRLSLNDTEIFDTTNSVDEFLLLDVIEEQEYTVDLILNQVYVLPLKRSHPIIRKIVDNLCIAELLSIHFVGQSFGIGTDFSGLGATAKQAAYQDLNALTIGLNIALPNQPIIPDYQKVRRIELIGEELITKLPQRELVNMEFIVGQYSKKGTEEEATWIEFIENEEDNPFGLEQYKQVDY